MTAQLHPDTALDLETLGLIFDALQRHSLVVHANVDVQRTALSDLLKTCPESFLAFLDTVVTFAESRASGRPPMQLRRLVAHWATGDDYGPDFSFKTVLWNAGDAAAPVWSIGVANAWAQNADGLIRVRPANDWERPRDLAEATLLTLAGGPTQAIYWQLARLELTIPFDLDPDVRMVRLGTALTELQAKKPAAYDRVVQALEVGLAARVGRTWARKVAEQNGLLGNVDFNAMLVQARKGYAGTIVPHE